MKHTYKILSFLLILFCTQYVQAAKYTLVASGNYTSPATWQGGKVPPVNLGADTLILSPSLSTFFLTLDVNLSLSALTMIDLVNTPIKESGKKYISMPAGYITSVLARIDVDSIYIGQGAGFLFNGSISAEKITLNGAHYDAGANSKTEIKNLLHLTGSPSYIGSMVHYGQSGTPPLFLLKFTDGGGLSVKSTVQFLFSYAAHTIYYGCPNYATMQGAYNEQGAKAIRRIEVDTKGQTDIHLKYNIDDDFTDYPLLVLTSGVFDMNGYNFDGSYEDKGGTGTIAAHAGSSLSLAGISTTHWDTLRLKDGFRWFSHFKAGKIVVDGDITADTVTLLNHGNLGIKNGKLDILTKNGIKSTGVSWIATDSNALVKVKTDNGKVFVPVGTYRDYMPTTISNIPTGTCRVYAVPGVRYGGFTGNLVPYRYCAVEASMVVVDTFPNIDIEIGWDTTATHLAFDYQNALLMRFDGTGWDKNVPPVAATKTNNMAYVKRSAVPSGMFAIVNSTAFAGIENSPAHLAGLDIYPNPASGRIGVFSRYKSATKISVYDMAGRKAMQAELAPGANTIDIKCLQPGAYTAIADTEKGGEVYRFSIL